MTTITIPRETFDAMLEALEGIGQYPFSRDQEMSAEAMRKIAREALTAANAVQEKTE